MKREFTIAEKIAIVNYLLSDRCENYGYDWKDFRRICQQRSKARMSVRRMLGIRSGLVTDGFGIDTLAWEHLTHRMTAETKAGKISVKYVPGQSSNEEITNVLRSLVDPEARWVS